MKTSTLATLAFTALTSALPHSSSGSSGSSKSSGKGGSSQPQCYSKQFLATFDDLTALPAAPLLPVGTYDGLTYNSFNVLNAGVAGQVVTGIVPQSGSNVATNAITNNLVTGAPALIPASPYKTLDLYSTYFGCVVNSAESVVGVPEQCTIAFTAYLPGSTVAYQTINENFDPQNAVRSNMAKATFPATWQRMGKIEMAIVQSSTTSPLTALFLDNVSYKVYEC